MYPKLHPDDVDEIWDTFSTKCIYLFFLSFCQTHFSISMSIITFLSDITRYFTDFMSDQIISNPLKTAEIHIHREQSGIQKMIWPYIFLYDQTSACKFKSVTIPSIFLSYPFYCIQRQTVSLPLGSVAYIILPFPAVPAVPEIQDTADIPFLSFA